jgi:hypothetical protein
MIVDVALDLSKEKRRAGDATSHRRVAKRRAIARKKRPRDPSVLWAGEALNGHQFPTFLGDVR